MPGPGVTLPGRPSCWDATAPEEQRILRTFWQLKQGGDADFDPMSEALFAWARQLVLQNGQV